MTSNDQIYSRIGTLEGKLDEFLTTVRGDLTDKETRLRKVESRQTWLMGVASGLSTAGGAIGYLASLYIHNKLGQPQI